MNVTPPQQVEAQTRNDIWAVELPYGMPKDTQLLPPHSQELLRAARSGRLYKRPAPADDDDADPDPALEKGEKKEDVADKGYTVKVWKQVPRTSEGPTVSHLAKRRKDTITLKPKAEVLQSTGPMITRATIRRVDAAGNPYEQTITLSEGQPVDGEIVSTSVIPAPVAPVEVQPQQVTPARRKPPPPRRKPKGPGRGRKKGRLPVPPSTRPPVGAPSTETSPAALQGGQPSNEVRWRTHFCDAFIHRWLIDPLPALADAQYDSPRFRGHGPKTRSSATVSHWTTRFPHRTTRMATRAMMETKVKRAMGTWIWTLAATRPTVARARLCRSRTSR